jgi:hypothetical protein
VLTPVDIVKAISDQDPVIYAGEYTGQGPDECSTCYFCGSLPHADTCLWVEAQAAEARRLMGCE